MTILTFPANGLLIWKTWTLRDLVVPPVSGFSGGEVSQRPDGESKDRMMELIFNNHNFAIIERDGRTWLTAADIAVALGYKRSDQVSRIFERHQREFSISMTSIVETVSLGNVNLINEVRVFSLRGAHMIDMFARTEQGVKFRAWVLDRLDELDRQAVPQRSLMAEWFKAKAAGRHADRLNRAAPPCSWPRRWQDGTSAMSHAGVWGRNPCSLATRDRM